MQWARYLRKTGTINLGKRLERGFALIATTFINANGGKAEMADFMPHLPKHIEVEDDTPLGIHEAFGMLKALAKK